MASDIKTIPEADGPNGPSQSYATVVAQWAQGWERRYREEVGGRAEAAPTAGVRLQAAPNFEKPRCC